MKPSDKNRRYFCVVVLDPVLIAALDEAKITVDLIPQGRWTFEPGATLGPTSWSAAASFAGEEKGRATPVGQSFAAAPEVPAVAVGRAVRKLAAACTAAAASLRKDALPHARKGAALTRAAALDEEGRTALRVADRFDAATPAQRRPL